MTKLFYLSTCSTCSRIIKDLDLDGTVELQDIKTEPMTEEQVDRMAELAGSYEALFSRRAMKYKSMGLNQMELGEQDYRKYILQEYTFLKRPVLLMQDSIFVGNSAKVVEAAKAALS